MAGMLFQFHASGDQPPSLTMVEAQWGLEAGDADGEYGVVPVDLRARIFVIRVTEAGARRLAARMAAGGDLHPATGLFGDPAQGQAR